MKVVVTFASSRETTSVELEGSPLQGAPEGSCVAHRLRDVRVPVFGCDQANLGRSRPAEQRGRNDERSAQAELLENTD